MRVVVAMSGGVDSAVAAGLLAEQGHDVVGVHMKLHEQSARPTPSPGHCCGLDDALDARRVADHLGIPFYVLDLREPFRKAVMDEFAQSYLAGRTPNPCVRCNGVLKFRVLMSRALALGADALATGHYARVVGSRTLAMATDRDKDQSYFLFPVTTAALEKTVFPLGGFTKTEVRAHAVRLGLPVALKPESQEVCFVPDDDHAAFVRDHAGATDASGEIVDEEGKVLGHHDAYYRFTVGQRRGLAVALGTKAYVLRVEADTRRVVVTTDPTRLGAMGLAAAEATWHERPSPDEVVGVRVRHRGRIEPARVEIREDGSFRATFDDPVRAVSPGQAAVVYRGETVLGGGWIDRAGVA